MTSTGLVQVALDAKGKTGLTTITVGPVGEQARAPKALADQIGVHIAVDQVSGGGDLRPGVAFGQVTARVRCRGIVL